MLLPTELKLDQTLRGELAGCSTSKQVLRGDNDTILGNYGVTSQLEKTSKA